jgi:hypothetical protein
VTMQEIEAWALRVVDAVRRGDRVEDSAVELKSDWPPPEKAARLIAAHANAARGNPILWVIGLHERKGVSARSPIEPADWWAQVSSFFDEVPPKLTDVVVQVGGGESVVAILFGTEQAPYVIAKKPDGGAVVREVPWREGTSIRSARRSDLVRILVPLSAAPRIEFVNAKVEADPEFHQSPGAPGTYGPGVSFRITGAVYLSCGQTYAVFPYRHLRVEIESDSGLAWTAYDVSLSATQPTPMGRQSNEPKVQTIHNGVEQLIVEGPGPAFLHARALVPDISGQPPAVDAFETLNVTLTAEGVDLPSPIFSACRLAKRATIAGAALGKNGVWTGPA